MRAHRSRDGAEGYRRIVVPLVDDPASVRALDVACRLASERNASITAVTVIEVPELLPLDAHMLEEEEDAQRLLRRAHAVGESYGVTVSPMILRAREAAEAIVSQATTAGAELVVIGNARNVRRSRRAPVFGRTVGDVLEKAPCRVMVIAAPAEPGRKAA